MFPRPFTFAFVFLLAASLNVAAAGTDAAAAPAATNDNSAASPLTITRVARRPLALTVLYGTYGTLQVMDIVSTEKAIRSGAREANPVMGSGNAARLIALKAAGSAASVYFAERMWKKNRVGAIATMAVLNVATAAIVARNTAHIRR